mmetsp:Transcript_5488/g.4675  ORF Transcript_5488/g.4675 Transcript_5488/m.4675 type:complete len:94 (+) Transcript_5488:684-965(+)
MKFDHFKLPKESLLSRFITISNKGEVQSIGDPKKANTIVNEIRCSILKEAWGQCFVILKKSQLRIKITESYTTKQRVVSLASIGYASFFIWKY